MGSVAHSSVSTLLFIISEAYFVRWVSELTAGVMNDCVCVISPAPQYPLTAGTMINPGQTCQTEQPGHTRPGRGGVCKSQQIQCCTSLQLFWEFVWPYLISLIHSVLICSGICCERVGIDGVRMKMNSICNYNASMTASLMLNLKEWSIAIMS